MSDYKRNPRGARRARKSMSRKALVVLSLMMVLVMAAVGGTIAWLVDDTDPVVNTFTVGDINIDLTETWNADGPDEDTQPDHWEGKIVPGVDLAKDPKVTVKAGSEACWVFVKVEPINWPTNSKISYTINTVEVGGAWTALPDNEGVYYIQQADLSAETTDAEYNVLKGNTVTVDKALTKTEIEAIKNALAEKGGKFNLKFTAYAIQQAKFDTAADAWAEISTTYP